MRPARKASQPIRWDPHSMTSRHSLQCDLPLAAMPRMGSDIFTAGATDAMSSRDKAPWPASSFSRHRLLGPDGSELFCHPLPSPQKSPMDPWPASMKAHSPLYTHNRAASFFMLGLLFSSSAPPPRPDRSSRTVLRLRDSLLRCSASTAAARDHGDAFARKGSETAKSIIWVVPVKVHEKVCRSLSWALLLETLLGCRTASCPCSGGLSVVDASPPVPSLSPPSSSDEQPAALPPAAPRSSVTAFFQ